MSISHWNSSQFSHQGNVRSYNEDACLVRKDMNLWVVADGMGGHAAGDVASNLIMEKLATISASDDLTEMIDNIDDALIAVNTTLKSVALEKYQGRTIGSTVVSMCAVGDFIAFLWAGDSRIYRIRDATITQLTKDHSEVQNLIDQGLLKPEEAESHPSANVINRAIGATDSLYLSTGIDKVLSGDIYILCSDGLYREVKEEEMLKLSTLNGPHEICVDLVSLALSREAKDNITVVVTRSE